MFKYATRLFLASICSVGCRNVGPKIGTETHVALFSQSALATRPNQSMANVTDSAVHVDSAKETSAKEKNADKRQAPVGPLPNAGKLPEAASSNGKGAVAEVAVANASDGLRHALCNAARHIAGTVVQAEEKVSQSVIAVARAASLSVKHVEAKPLLAHQYKTAANPDQMPENDPAKRVWYWVASIAGAVFTCVLGPLIVELIKLRAGCYRFQLNSDKPFPRADSTRPQRC